MVTLSMLASCCMTVAPLIIAGVELHFKADWNREMYFPVLETML